MKELDINYEIINGKQYIADIDIEKLLSKNKEYVFSMRFGNNKWQDDKGHSCILVKTDGVNNNITEYRKIYCEEIDGYDYIEEQEFKDKILPLL